MFKCYNILTDLGITPPLGMGGVDGWCVGGCGWMGVPHASTHVHACMNAHMNAHHVKHDKHGCLHGGGHLQLLYMYILVLCMCICMCVYT